MKDSIVSVITDYLNPQLMDTFIWGTCLAKLYYLCAQLEV